MFVATSLGLAAMMSPADAGTISEPLSRPCAHSAHPRPVVLIHDIAGSSSSWDVASTSLAARGRCVRVIDYGRNEGLAGLLPGGMTSIAASARELASLLATVRTANPGQPIDLVAHGTGSLVALSYLQMYREDAAVRSLTSLGSLWDGTNIGGLGTLEQVSRNLGTYRLILSIEAALEDPFCAACRELITGSDFLRAMRSRGLTIVGVRQTNIISASDGFVVPATSGFAQGMTNLRLQDLDPSARDGHFGLPHSSLAIDLVDRAIGK